MKKWRRRGESTEGHRDLKEIQETTDIVKEKIENIRTTIISKELLSHLEKKIDLWNVSPFWDILENLLQILKFTDFVLIPTKAGIADLLAIRSTIDVVKRSQKLNPKLKAAVVLNMVKYGTTLTEDVRKQIEEIDITLLKTQISDRVNFTRSIALSSAIYGIGDFKAEKEMDNLTREVLLALNI